MTEQSTTKGKQTRESILTASARLFEEKGYHDTGIADIARDLKIAQGTLYQYFRGKEELITEVLAWSEKRLLESLESLALPSKTGTPESMMREIHRAFQNHAETCCDHFTIYFSLPSELTAAYRGNGPPFARIIAAIEKAFSPFADSFDPGLRSGELGLLVFMNVETVRMMKHVPGWDKKESQSLIDRRIGFLLHGIAPIISRRK